MTYHTGDLQEPRPGCAEARSKFEGHADPHRRQTHRLHRAVQCRGGARPRQRARARRRYDPQIKTDYRPANMFACRGVAVWHGPTGATRPCTERILTATADLQLIALDLKDGRPCLGFGQDGAVRIDPGKPLLWPGEFQFTSPPAVIGDLVILGSSIGDNQRVDAPRGTVRAFDVRTGVAPRWDCRTRCRGAPMTRTRRARGDGWRTTGAANVWAPIADRRGTRPSVSADHQPEPRFLWRPSPGRQSPRRFLVVALKAREEPV